MLSLLLPTDIFKPSLHDLNEIKNNLPSSSDNMLMMNSMSRVPSGVNHCSPIASTKNKRKNFTPRSFGRSEESNSIPNPTFRSDEADNHEKCDDFLDYSSPVTSMVASTSHYDIPNSQHVPKSCEQPLDLSYKKNKKIGDFSDKLSSRDKIIFSPQNDEIPYSEQIYFPSNNDNDSKVSFNDHINSSSHWPPLTKRRLTREERGIDAKPLSNNLLDKRYTWHQRLSNYYSYGREPTHNNSKRTIPPISHKYYPEVYPKKNDNKIINSHKLVLESFHHKNKESISKCSKVSRWKESLLNYPFRDPNGIKSFSTKRYLLHGGSIQYQQTHTGEQINSHSNEKHFFKPFHAAPNQFTSFKSSNQLADNYLIDRITKTERDKHTFHIQGQKKRTASHFSQTHISKPTNKIYTGQLVAQYSMYEQGKICDFYPEGESHDCSHSSLEHFHCKGDFSSCNEPFLTKDIFKEHFKTHEHEDAIFESSYKIYDDLTVCNFSSCSFLQSKHFHCVWAGCLKAFAFNSTPDRINHYKKHQIDTWSMISDDPIHTTSNFQTTNIFHAGGKRKRGRPPKNRILDTPLQNTIAYAFESGSLCPFKSTSRKGVDDNNFSQDNRGSNVINTRSESDWDSGEDNKDNIKPQFKYGEFDLNLREIQHHNTPSHMIKIENFDTQNIYKPHKINLAKPKMTLPTPKLVQTPRNRPHSVKPNLVGNDSMGKCRDVVITHDKKRALDHSASLSGNDEESGDKISITSIPRKLKDDEEPNTKNNGNTNTSIPTSRNDKIIYHHSPFPQRITYNMEKMAAKRKNCKNQEYKSLCLTFIPYKRLSKLKKTP
ncbi:unnamed protein product [Gordionus sp. m RMFG-2023]|uniref:uncharacterized protein LOC135923931 n=1 Tax=Gordionus sp. m RMFG-2023 TaxID=3053472 RepID=UPI0030DE6CB9